MNYYVVVFEIQVSSEADHLTDAGYDEIVQKARAEVNRPGCETTIYKVDKNFEKALP